MISYASRGTRVQTGDVIASGTVGTGCILELAPCTVGGGAVAGARRAGELEVEGLGVLANRVGATTARSPSPRTVVSGGWFDREDGDVRGGCGRGERPRVSVQVVTGEPIVTRATDMYRQMLSAAGVEGAEEATAPGRPPWRRSFHVAVDDTGRVLGVILARLGSFDRLSIAACSIPRSAWRGPSRGAHRA